jgi:DNA-binding MarR family transcriptional regulator
MYIGCVSQTKPREQTAAELLTYAVRITRAVRRTRSSQTPAALERLLSQLDELGPTTVTELAASDRCSQPTMSALVGGLVERGWAAKTPNPEDARSSLVAVTAEGRQVIDCVRRENGAVLARRLADTPYTEQDVRKAVDILKTLFEQGKS